MPPFDASFDAVQFISFNIWLEFDETRPGLWKTTSSNF